MTRHFQALDFMSENPGTNEQKSKQIKRAILRQKVNRLKELS